MISSLLVTAKDGSVHLVAPKKGAERPAAGDKIDEGPAGRVVEDVLDLSLSARLATDLQSEKDPEKFKENLEKASADIKTMLDKFAALFRLDSDQGQSRSFGETFRDIIERYSPKDKA